MRIAVALILSALLAQTPTPRGVIEGRVVRMGTQDPIPDVLVTLVSATANVTPASTVVSPATAAVVLNSAAAGVPAGVQPTAITDASGHFVFRDVASGRYTLRAQADGYFSTPVYGLSSPVATANLVFGPGDAIVSKDISMVKGGVIHGRVRDPQGQPIPGLSVSAYVVTYTNGRKAWSISRSIPTDDRGEYRLFWLTPGEYFVGATPKTPSTVPGPQDQWLRTFFPGVSDPAAAVPIRIRDGSDMPNTDIDIIAASSPGFRISGIAINPLARANPTTGVIDKSIPAFFLSPRESGVLDATTPPSIMNTIPLQSRPNGEFEIRNIRPGLYDLYPAPAMLTDPVPGSNPSAPPPQTTVRLIDGTSFVTPSGVLTMRRQPTSRTPVNVNGDITGLQIVVNNGIDLTGEVVISGPAQTIKPDSVRLALRSLDTTPAAFISLIGTISVDAAGKFKVVSVPEGRYTFQLAGSLPVGAYVADIRQGGLSVMDDGFLLDATALPVQVVINGAGVTVEGTVQTADRKPGSNATVVLIPPASRRKNALLYKTTIANEDGRFTMSGVAPGPYKIFAFESIPAGAFLNAEYIAKYEELGRPVIIPGSLEAPLSLIHGR